MSALAPARGPGLLGEAQPNLATGGTQNKEKPPIFSIEGFWIKPLAVTYSRMA
jgi:hypothetical protein